MSSNKTPSKGLSEKEFDEFVEFVQDPKNSEVLEIFKSPERFMAFLNANPDFSDQVMRELASSGFKPEIREPESHQDEGETAEEVKRKTAKSYLVNGMAPDAVVEATGLSSREIADLIIELESSS